MCNERLYSSARSPVFYFILRRNQLHTYIQYYILTADTILYCICFVFLSFLTTEPSWYDLLRLFHLQNRRWHALEEQPKTNNKINKIIHKKNKSRKIERQNYRRGLTCKAHRTEAHRRQARTEWWWQNWVWEHGEGGSDVKNRLPTQALRTVDRLVNADLLMHKLLVI